MNKKPKSITITLDPDVYRDLRNIAVIRHMNGAAAESVADEFLMKLFRVMDKDMDKYHFKYKPGMEVG